MDHKCNKEATLEMIREDLQELRADVKTLLVSNADLRAKSGFWGMIGGSLTFVVGYIAFLMKR